MEIKIQEETSLFLGPLVMILEAFSGEVDAGSR